MTSAEPPNHGRVQRGALVRLPVDEDVALAAGAGLDFVIVDLVGGPFDELSLRRAVLLAEGVGIAVLALVGEGADSRRLSELGVGAVVDTARSTADDTRPVALADGLSGDLAIVNSDDEARHAAARGATFVALDVRRAVADVLGSFADTAPRPERETLVLLPGMLGGPCLYDSVVTSLPSDVECRPMRIDLDDSIEEIAASVLAAAPPRFALAGHSLGGIVALEVWRQARHRVTRLALLNNSARPPSDTHLEVWSAMRDRTEAGEFTAVARELAQLSCDGIAVGAAAGDQSSLFENWVAMAEGVGPDGFLRQLRAQSSRPDSRPSLGDIDAPTLVLSGSDDTVCPVELQEELAAGIPGARHVTIAGAGHMTPLDHPAEVAAELVTWLRT